VAVASAGPYANLHLDPDTQPRRHPTTQYFTGWMPFLPPNHSLSFAPINLDWFYLPGFTFLVPARPGSLNKIQEGRKWLCVCDVDVEK